MSRFSSNYLPFGQLLLFSMGSVFSSCTNKMPDCSSSELAKQTRCVPAPVSLTYIGMPTSKEIQAGSPLELKPSVAGEISKWIIDKDLPSGIELDAKTGVISGVPKIITPLTQYKITASNISGKSVATIEFSTVFGNRYLGVDDAQTLIQGVITDSERNAIVYGYTNGAVALPKTIGTTDFIVSKHSMHGAQKWISQIGKSFSSGGVTQGQSNAYAFSGSIDSDQNIVIAGHLNGFFSGINTWYNVPFLASYSASGSTAGIVQNGVTDAHTYVYGVATDLNKNIYVAGCTRGNLLGNSLTGAMDSYIIKYSGTKELVWTKLLGSVSQSTCIRAIAIDSAHSTAYVAGYTDGILSGVNLTGIQDLFVAKYDISDGTRVWTTLLGAASKTTEAVAIDYDSSENVYVAGFTNGALPGNSLQGIQDAFVAKFGRMGSLAFARQIGDDGTEAKATAIKLTKENKIVLGGYSNGSINGVKVIGNVDSFITRMDPSGVIEWTQKIGFTKGTSKLAGLSVDSDQNVFVVTQTDVSPRGGKKSGVMFSILSKYNSEGAKQ